VLLERNSHCKKTLLELPLPETALAQPSFRPRAPTNTLQTAAPAPLGRALCLLQPTLAQGLRQRAGPGESRPGPWQPPLLQGEEVGLDSLDTQSPASGNLAPSDGTRPRPNKCIPSHLSFGDIASDPWPNYNAIPPTKKSTLHPTFQKPSS